MSVLFRAAKQNRIFEDVVDQIQEAIIDGRLQAGDRLPSERELKGVLQTSRSTLREALRVLEQKGLIEIRLGMGGGAIVKTLNEDQVTESLDLLLRSQKASLNHLAEFREGVEGDVVAIAAERATNSDIERLRSLLDEAAACVERGVEHLDDFLKVDTELHLTFAYITENPVYISVLKSIHDNIHRYYEIYLVMDQPELEENLRDLERIVSAVEDRNTPRARELAQCHVQRFNQYMSRQALEMQA
ncbi:Transcriptional regulator, GntR family [Olavius algarvensis associated proteobacterium Delta 3]|nr:Transcriptional regulator, GntR family [Olavius algarvensis associated proteobacterium Delta 3]